MCLKNIETKRVRCRYAYKIFTRVGKTLYTKYAGMKIKEDTKKWHKPPTSEATYDKLRKCKCINKYECNGIIYSENHIGLFSAFLNKCSAVSDNSCNDSGEIWKVEIRDKKAVFGTFWGFPSILVSEFRLVKKIN